MTHDDRLGEERLSPEGAAALAAVVEADVDAVAATLAAAAPGGPVYAACLYYGPDEDELLDPSAVYLGLEADREGALRDRPAAHAFREVWNAMTYRGGELDVLPPPRDAPGFEDAERLLAGELEQLGAEDRARWVLNRVARLLTAMELELARTDDFVVFVLDGQLGEALLENIRFSAPPDVADALEGKGVLPGSYDELARQLRER